MSDQQQEHTGSASSSSSAPTINSDNGAPRYPPRPADDESSSRVGYRADYVTGAAATTPGVGSGAASSVGASSSTIASSTNATTASAEGGDYGAPKFVKGESERKEWAEVLSNLSCSKEVILNATTFALEHSDVAKVLFDFLLETLRDHEDYEKKLALLYIIDCISKTSHRKNLRAFREVIAAGMVDVIHEFPLDDTNLTKILSVWKESMVYTSDDLRQFRYHLACKCSLRHNNTPASKMLSPHEIRRRKRKEEEEVQRKIEEYRRESKKRRLEEALRKDGSLSEFDILWNSTTADSNEPSSPERPPPPEPEVRQSRSVGNASPSSIPVSSASLQPLKTGSPHTPPSTHSHSHSHSHSPLPHPSQISKPTPAPVTVTPPQLVTPQLATPQLPPQFISLPQGPQAAVAFPPQFPPTVQLLPQQFGMAIPPGTPIFFPPIYGAMYPPLTPPPRRGGHHYPYNPALYQPHPRTQQHPVQPQLLPPQVPQQQQQPPPQQPRQHPQQPQQPFQRPVVPSTTVTTSVSTTPHSHVAATQSHHQQPTNRTTNSTSTTSGSTPSATPYSPSSSSSP
ncbi:hypothetical protein Pelo_3851 [Pelomyxa schiedti]|nr:hypothetical protein Pelo_3851 [Pelomyxa schiedti]